MSKSTTSISTFTKRNYDYLYPENDIDIIDISIGLSREGRFCGQTLDSYHVATHSVNVALLIMNGLSQPAPGLYKFLNSEYIPSISLMQLPWDLTKLLVAKGALFHDASEAYMRDIPSPLKSLLPDYVKIEHSVQYGIHKKFNLENEFFSIALWKDIIARADRAMFEVEYPLYMDKGYTPSNTDAYAAKRFIEMEYKNKLYLDPIESDRSNLIFLSHYFHLNNLIQIEVEKYASYTTWAPYFMNNKD